MGGYISRSSCPQSVWEFTSSDATLNSLVSLDSTSSPTNIVIGDFNAHTVPSGTYTFQLTATVDGVTSSSAVSIDIIVCQVVDQISISGGPVISSMTLTNDQSNWDVDISTGSVLAATMLDKIG